MKNKRKLLLHSCCGPCSTAVVERLIKDYKITIYFYNPNITDREEYERRKLAQLEFIHKYNQVSDGLDIIDMIEGEYDPDSFYSIAEGLEKEPEGGSRCRQCFKLRMNKTAEMAHSLGCDFFGTTLSVSPHKDYSVICSLGKMISHEMGVNFLDENFKKKAGFQRSVQISKEYGLYRQNYCGCEFSK